MRGAWAIVSAEQGDDDKMTEQNDFGKRDFGKRDFGKRDFAQNDFAQCGGETGKTENKNKTNEAADSSSNVVEQYEIQLMSMERKTGERVEALPV
ncbi:MAG: hypothetical protein Kow00121_32930 [Elainellaceae cyanobacterium]